MKYLHQQHSGGVMIMCGGRFFLNKNALIATVKMVAALLLTGG